MSTDVDSRRDLTAKQGAIGAGVAYRWCCMHCGKVRPLTGSRGAGVRRRCAACVAAEARA